jgi:hypothetical protein
LRGLSFGSFFSNLISSFKSINFVKAGAQIGSNVGSAVLSGLSNTFSASKTLFGGIVKLASRFTPIAAIIAGIEEAFTGDLASAMGFGDGFGGRILGVIFGTFRGLATSITDAFDWIFNSITEGLGFDFKINSTAMVDALLSIISATGKHLLASGAKILATILESLPFVSKDAPWVKSLRATSQSLVDSADRDFKNTEDLIANAADSSRKEKMTLETIGKKMRESSEKDKREVAKNITDTSSKVAHGYEGLLASARDTTKQLQAQVADKSKIEQDSKTASVSTKTDKEKTVATPAVSTKTDTEKTVATSAVSTKTDKVDIIKATRLEIDLINAKSASIGLAMNDKNSNSEEANSRALKFLLDSFSPTSSMMQVADKLNADISAILQPVKQPALSADIVQATPTVQSRPTVTPPEVNKSETSQPAKTTSAPDGALQPSEGETVTISRRQLEVLQAIHQAILGQSDKDEEIVAKLEQSGRRSALTTNLIYNRVVS